MLDVHSEVDRNDASAGRLKELDVRCLDVLFALKRIIVARDAELCALLVDELLTDAVEFAVPKSVGRSDVRAW